MPPEVRPQLLAVAGVLPSPHQPLRVPLGLSSCYWDAGHIGFGSSLMPSSELDYACNNPISK